MTTAESHYLHGKSALVFGCSIKKITRRKDFHVSYSQAVACLDFIDYNVGTHIEKRVVDVLEI